MQKSQNSTEEGRKPTEAEVEERKLAERKKKQGPKKTFAGNGVEKRG